LINPDPADLTNSWALFSTDAQSRSPNAAQTSFWADNEHLAAAAQLIEGNYLIQVAESVPEPSTWGMTILGFAGVALMAYRRRKSAMLAA
jgi:hypothetical protein